jgi:carbonic anhydrase
VIQDAWARGQDVNVHAWIYGLRDGRLRDLDFDSSSWLKERSGLR